MSKKSTADVDQTTSDEAKPSKGKKLILLGVAAVLLAVAGGAAKFMLLDSPKAPTAPEPGAVVALEPVTINLTDGHYLKVKLALQAVAGGESGGHGGGTSGPDGSKALDLAITQFSQSSMDELASPQGRATAKKQLVQTVKKAYHDEIMDIYFTEFVMQ